MNATHTHLSLACSVILTPRRAGLRAGQDNTVELLVRVQAPDAPAEHAAQRPAQALALVIDRSGSMHGRPLAEARRCAAHLISSLRPSDSVSLVAFDHRVQRLWPALPVGDGVAQHAALAAVASGGNTDLHGGWRAGADTLAEVSGNGLKRVIVLSDGQANTGLTDAAEIAAQCATWADQGISTSTYGLGNGFNEALMVAMARAGGGNHYYGDSAEDLMQPFQQELELLANLCLRELRLTLTTAPGVELEVLNRLPRAEGGWRLPDLAWGAEGWAVLRLKLTAAVLPPPGQHLPLLQTRVWGRSLDGQSLTLERARLALPVMSGLAFDDLADDELVGRRLAELAAAESLARMRTAAALDDWTAVDRLLAQASRQFAGNAWVAQMLAAMAQIAQGRERERMVKEATYSELALATRLAAKDEGAAFLAAEEAHGRPAYLRRKRTQGKGDL